MLAMPVYVLMQDKALLISLQQLCQPHAHRSAHRSHTNVPPMQGTTTAMGMGGGAGGPMPSGGMEGPGAGMGSAGGPMPAGGSGALPMGPMPATTATSVAGRRLQSL